MRIYMYSIACLLVAVFTGCKEADLMDYNQKPRINFAGEYSSATDYAITVVEFNDEDYLNNVMEKRDSIKITLLGEQLTTPLKYCVTTMRDTSTDYASQPILNTSYEFPRGTFTTELKYKVKRPEVYGQKHKTFIVFDLENPENEFLPGLKEGLYCTCEVTYRLEPIIGWGARLWNSTFLGVYSNGKYKFIIDTYGEVYKNLTIDAQFRDKVRIAYEEYRTAGGVPIMDDEKKPQEIVFPVK